MRTFNKKGDGGETSLLFGVRVGKNDLRCEAYGTIDEAVSILGLAKNFCGPETRDILSGLQRELFLVGGELATPFDRHSQLEAKGTVVGPEMVQKLEDLIDEFESRVEMPREFVIPGGSVSSATLDIARATIRRAERRSVDLRDAGEIENQHVLGYMNRLADLLFTLARYEEKGESNPGN